jgi:polysaccharide export outer membrane protein
MTVRSGNTEEGMKRVFSLWAIVVALAWFTCPASAQDLPYIIHPGDQILVSVYGETTLTQTVNVLPDGYVDLPLVGRVRLAGKTTEVARRDVARALMQYIRKPVVSLEIVTQGQMTALVLGDVKTPGKYSLRSTAKLSDAIAAAGGLDGSLVGALPVARVQNDGAAVRTASLEALLRDGDTTQDLPLRDGAVVYVQSRQTISVDVIGAVDHPGEVQLHDGDRLSAAIAKAGNSAGAQSDLSHVYLRQKSANGADVTAEYDMYRALEHGELAGDPKLNNGDLVYVPQSRKGGSNGSGILNFLRAVLGFWI